MPSNLVFIDVYFPYDWRGVQFCNFYNLKSSHQLLWFCQHWERKDLKEHYNSAFLKTVFWNTLLVFAETLQWLNFVFSNLFHSLSSIPTTPFCKCTNIMDNVEKQNDWKLVYFPKTRNVAIVYCSRWMIRQISECYLGHWMLCRNGYGWSHVKERNK